MWESTEISFGNVFEDDHVRSIFKFTDNCSPENVQLHPSCGCTGVSWIESTGEVHVGYVANKIPRHLSETFMNIRKSIKVIYLCNGIQHTDTLAIVGTVNKKI